MVAKVVVSFPTITFLIIFPDWSSHSLSIMPYHNPPRDNTKNDRHDSLTFFNITSGFTSIPALTSGFCKQKNNPQINNTKKYTKYAWPTIINLLHNFHVCTSHYHPSFLRLNKAKANCRIIAFTLIFRPFSIFHSSKRQAYAKGLHNYKTLPTSRIPHNTNSGSGS